MFQKFLEFLVSLIQKNPEVIAEFALGKPAEPRCTGPLGEDGICPKCGVDANETAPREPTTTQLKETGYQLKYFRYESEGIFGHLIFGDKVIGFVLDEPVLQSDGSYLPVVLPGTYTCKRYRSPHFGYDVFQILDVPGHTYIEIHIGNRLSDTHGCLLLGTAIEGSALTESKKAFDSFMASMEGIDTFTLVVTE